MFKDSRRPKNLHNGSVKQSLRFPPRRKLYLAIVAATQLLASARGYAGPEGGQVVGGTGSIHQSGNETIIDQHSDRLAIDWSSFNVDSDERVEFIQPNSSSIALNRILSHEGSEIHGRIDANGRVFLVNPNGVFFGEGARINVGGILASGLTIDPTDFMNGEFAFSSLEGSSGAVVNAGIINAATGGSVGLLGRSVRNEGMINANLGSVNLVAGNEAVVTFEADALMGIRVTEEVLQNDIGVEAAVINSGDITARGGRILLSASASQNIFSAAVNSGDMSRSRSVVVHEDGSFTLGGGADLVNSGSVDVSIEEGAAGEIVMLGENITSSGEVLADAVTGSAGHVEIHSRDTTRLTEAGRVSARSFGAGQGGDVKILGNKVGLFDSTDVDASGANGGGQVLIGGDESGQNNRVRNAEFVYVAEAASAHADALLNGDGGKLITFAEDTARLYGSLSARGGNESGDGGFVETSGLAGFEILKTPDVSAALGNAGTWLIDPHNIIITGSGAPETSQDGRTFDSITSDSYLHVNTLEGALSNGVTVVVTTDQGRDEDTGEYAGVGTGNITFAENTRLHYSLAGPGRRATLRLEGNNIVFEQGSEVDNKSSGGSDSDDSLNLELMASGDVTFAADVMVDTNGGYFSAGTAENPVESFDVSGGSIVLTNGGSLTSINRTFTNSGTIQTSGGLFSSESMQGFNNTEIISTVGRQGAAGGAIEIKVTDPDGNIQAGSLTSNGGAHTTRNGTADPGLNAGHIKLTGGQIILDADLSALGSNGEYSWAVQGTGGAILLDGNVELTDDVSIHSGNVGGNYGAGTWGDITITGTVNSSQNEAHDLTIRGSKVHFQDSVGSGEDASLGELIIDSKADVSFASAPEDPQQPARKDITAESLNVNSTSFIANDIRTSGEVDIDAGTGGIVTGSINTSGVGMAGGGNLTLLGGVLSLGDINTSAGEGTGANAEAGEISITATATEDYAASITIDGNIFAVNSDDTHASAVLSLNDSYGHENSVVFSGNEFISSDVTVHGSNSTKDTVAVTETSRTWFIEGQGEGRIVEPHGTIFFTNMESLIGSAKDDTFTIETTEDIEMSIHGEGPDAPDPEDNSVGDKLIAANRENIWVVNGSTGNTLNDFTFGGIENLSGNDTTDTFTINDVTAVAGLIDGGDGQDVLSILSTETVTVEFGSAVNEHLNAVDIEDLRGNGSNSTLYVSSTGSEQIEWSISAENEGSVDGTLQFRDFAHLRGGDGNDTFSVESVDGTIESADGGLGFNEVDLSEMTGLGSSDGEPAGQFTLLLSSSSGSGFSNVSRVRGKDDDDAPYVTLAAESGSNTWWISNFDIDSGEDAVTDGTNDGKVTVDGEDEENAIEFINFANLRGGSGNDTFIIAETDVSITRHIDGGTGTNTIRGPEDNVIWTINAINSGGLTAAGDDSNSYIQSFSNIQNIRGGDLDDTFLLMNVDANLSSADGGEGMGTDTVDLSEMVGLGPDLEEEVHTFTLEVSATDTGGFTNISRVVGNTGNSEYITLAAVGGTNTWTIFDFDGDNGDIAAIDGENDGRIELNDSGNTREIDFIDFSNIAGGSGSDSFVVQEGASIGSILGRDGQNTLTVESSAETEVSWIITSENAGNVSTVVGSFDGIQTLSGGSGDDMFLFDSGTAAITGTVDGGAGTNSLTGRNQATDWHITGANAGYLAIAGENPEVRYVGTFNSVHNFVGTDAADTFILYDESDFGSADGGGGSNTADLSNKTGSFTVTIGDSDIFGIVNVSSVIGNDHADTVLGITTGNNTWTISAENAGTVASDDDDVLSGTMIFAGFANLTGGNGSDDFNFGSSTAAISGTVDGGAGTNSLTGRNLATDWHITGANAGYLESAGEDPGVRYVGAFNSIHDFVGNDDADTFVLYEGSSFTSADGGSGENTVDLSDKADALDITLDAPDIFGVVNVSSVIGNDHQDTVLGITTGNNTWTISAENAGTLVSDGVDVLSGTMTFAGFANLTGGDGNDDFVFDSSTAAISGTVDGGAGTNSLAGRNQDTDWHIIGSNSGYLAIEGEDPEVRYVGAFDSIHDFVGNDAADTFILYEGSSFTSADGGSGNNTVDLSGKDNALNITLDAPAIHGVTNVSSVIGNNHQDTVLGITTGNNTWTISAENAGTVVSDDEDILSGAMTFAGFANLTGGSGSDDFVFNNTAAISGTVDGGAGTNSITGRNQATDWHITGEDMGYLAISGEESEVRYVHAFSSIQELLGGDEADSFIFTDAGSVSRADGGGGHNAANLALRTGGFELTLGDLGDFAVSNISEIVGNGHADTVLGISGGNNTWSISAENAGSVVSDDTNVLSGTMAFSGFSNLAGGNGNDDFLFNSSTAAISGTVDGGAGTNSLTGRDQATDWHVTGINSGYLAIAGEDLEVRYVGAFDSIHDLIGSDAADRFVLYDESTFGSADGGAGSNTADLSNKTGAFTATMNDSGIFGVSNVNSVIGNDHADTVLGITTGNNIWTINAENAGTVVSDDDDVLSGTMTFTGFANLTGGDSSDDFVFNSSTAAISGTIDGGAGANSLTGRDQATDWHITGTASGYLAIGGEDPEVRYVGAFSSIHDFIGNDAADTFILYEGGSFSSADGGNGNNTVDLSDKADALNITLDGPDIFGVINVSSVIGNDHADTVLGITTGNNTWTINGENAGTVVSDDDDVLSGTMTFAGFANLTGGDGNDDFVFDSSTAAISGTVDGGAGTNSLAGRNQATDWHITDANSGYLAIADVAPEVRYVGAFDSIHDFVGNDAADTFILYEGSSFSSADGGSGDNTVDLSDIADALDITLDSPDIFGVVNVSSVVGNDHADTVLGITTGNNTWTINAENAGTVVSDDDEVLSGTMTFTGFANLIGGDGDDEFLFNSSTAAISGTVHGGDGANSLTGRNQVTDWHITDENIGYLAVTGDETELRYVHAFSSIQTLIGGDEADSFTFTNTGSVSRADGGGGHNTANLASRTGGFNLTLGNLGDFAVSNISYIVGNGHEDTVLGISGGNNTWLISAENAGSVVSDDTAVLHESVTFTGFANLVGSGGNDDFVFSRRMAAITGSVDGGAGTNSLTGRNQATQWHITDADAGYLAIGGQDSDVRYVGEFRSVQNLIGSDASDTFIVYDESSFNSADGGSGNNTLDLSEKTGAFSVTLGESDIFGVINISSVIGNDHADTLLGITGGNNAWRVTAQNSGTVVSDDSTVLVGIMNFSGFANLAGADGSDYFTLDGASVSGTIDGAGGSNGLEATSGENTWRLIGQFEGSLNDIEFFGIQTVVGGSEQDTLIGRGQNNFWQITDSGRGTVSEINSGDDMVVFGGMENLVGNSGSDDFVFDNGTLGGSIHGGGGSNSLTLVAGDNGWTLSDRHTGLVNAIEFTAIQSLHGGSGSDSLTGRQQDNNWVVIGNGAGTVVAAEAAASDLINFSGMDNLIGNVGADDFILDTGSISGNLSGGDGNDTFNLNNASLTGAIDGGKGNDVIYLEVVVGATGQLVVGGGTGDDTIEVTGGAETYDAEHVASSLQSGELKYTNEAAVYSVQYAGVSTVRDNLIAKSLRIGGTSDADSFELGNNSYSLNGSSNVHFDNKDNVLFAGGSDDTLLVNGAIEVGGQIAVRNAAIVSSDGGLLQAQRLRLDGTGSVGSADQRLQTDISELLVSNVRGDIYLQQQESLNVTEFATNNRFDVELLSGDFTSSAALTSAGTFAVSTSNGSILLNHNNALAGDLSLSASETIALTNTPTTKLTSVNAQELFIQSGGAINGVGPVVVAGMTTLESEGNISLDHAANDFNVVAVGSANHVTLVDSTALTLNGITADGNVNLSSEGLTVNGSINAAAVMLDARQGSALLANNITAANAVSVSAQGIDLAGQVSGSRIHLDGQQASVRLDGELNSKEGSVEVSGHGIAQNAGITSAGATTLNSSDYLSQDSDITSAGDIQLVANTELMMSEDSTSKGKHLTYTAGDTMTLGKLEASEGVTVRAGDSLDLRGNILSRNGDLAITAGSITAANGTVLDASRSVVLNSRSGMVVSRIDAGTDIDLVAANNIAVSDSLNAETGAINVRGGGDIELTGDLNAQTEIGVVTRGGSIQQNAGIQVADGDLALSASGNISMSNNASSNANSIDYSAHDVAIAGLGAETVRISAAGSIADSNGDTTNVTARRLELVAESGIGAGGAIDTMVSELDLTNNAGSSRIRNGMELRVDGLRSNGDISLTNTEGTVYLNNGDGRLYSRSASDARNAGGTADANYNIGTLVIDVVEGDLLATAPASLHDPVISARNASLITRRGAIGQGARPMVLYVKDNLLLISALPSWRLYAFSSPPTNVDDSESISGDLTDLLAAGNEQLVEIEGLEDIDPAVFSNVRNFTFDDISILLPRDQRYQDDDDEY